MSALSNALIKAVAPACSAPRPFTDTERSIAQGLLRKQAADKRKRLDKGWDTKVSFKTYQKLHAQEVL